jgi:hypothetical protein
VPPWIMISMSVYEPGWFRYCPLVGYFPALSDSVRLHNGNGSHLG